MRLTRVLVIAALLTVGAGVAALAQSREYRISGTVVDSEQRPIAGAAVEIRERTSRQGFKVKTDAAGVFKLTGLPHGFFEVTFTKAGYQSRTDQWDLSAPQEPMKKVEYNPYVLLSDEQVAARERNAAQEKAFEGRRRRSAAATPPPRCRSSKSSSPSARATPTRASCWRCATCRAAGPPPPRPSSNG